MLDVRANLVIKASTSLARALTIAIRFSAVRRQGFAGEAATADNERPVLDYPTQQRGLFPLLAYAYALHFTGERMRVDYAAEALGRRAAEAGRAARAHCQLHLLQHFAAAVQALQAQASAGPCAAVINEREAAVLRDLCSLFALSTIEADLGQFRDQDTISSQDARQVLHLISDLCARIRPEAVALVDAFHFSDKYLGSAIGRFDGNIYPALMEWALREPLNASEVAESLPHIKLLVGTHPGARL
eukprot:TRINITY_DN11077_c0_g1_i2.p1 TRINITY_DN11077_c0_g1~~TRINITY_DN11077_c0_g1_i2.p1  ORF type:complete len:245 (+),score=104.06 TRINITY_DN11077_c0_g1_i2:437-1171(+)